MKKLILLFSLVLCCSFIFAQGKYEEVVYLKDGTVRRGMIMEYVPNISLKIATHDSLYSYKLDEIVKITRELPQPVVIPPYDFRKKGYVGIVELGVVEYPVENADMPRFSINVINGYQFNPYFALGLGVGADISNANIYDVPVTMDMRIYTGRKKAAPFFAFGLGYNMTIQSNYSSFYNEDNHVSGIIFNPSFGTRIAINKKAALSFGFGYKLLALHYKYNFNRQNAFQPENGVTFKIGVHF
jgi:hypothetical protein